MATEDLDREAEARKVDDGRNPAFERRLFRAAWDSARSEKEE